MQLCVAKQGIIINFIISTFIHLEKSDEEMKMALLLLVSDTFLSTFILVSLTWNKPRESCLVPDVRHPQWKYEYSAHPHQPPVTGSVLAARSSHQITIQDNWVAASAAPKPRHQTPRLAQGYLRITRHGAWMQPPPIRVYKTRSTRPIDAKLWKKLCLWIMFNIKISL